MTHLSAQFIEEMKQKLLEEKSRLENELAGLSMHTEMGNEVEDNADEVAVDEANTGVRVRIEADLEKIEKSLAKIAEGTYGVDEEGKEISEERLKVLPWADKAI